MRTLIGAVAGALAVSAVLVSYNLGARHAVAGDMAVMPTTQMMIGPDGVARPYVVRTGQAALGATWQVANASEPVGLQYAPMPVAAPVSYAAYPVQAQYTSPSVVSEQPAPRRVSTQRTATVRRAAPERTWQKSALLIGGSAGAGAGLGALMGGKKGALAGAAVGGGAAAIFDQVKRR